MTEKERKHQYYLAHKQEFIERVRKWDEAHRERKIELVRRSEAKRRAAMTPEELEAYHQLINARSRESYRRRIANETTEQREARLAHNRDRALAKRRAQGIQPRKPRMSKEECLARKRAWYYNNRYPDDAARRQYERDRKRAYRERLRNTDNPSEANH